MKLFYFFSIILFGFQIIESNPPVDLKIKWKAREELRKRIEEANENCVKAIKKHDLNQFKLNLIELKNKVGMWNIWDSGYLEECSELNNLACCYYKKTSSYTQQKYRLKQLKNSIIPSAGSCLGL